MKAMIVENQFKNWKALATLSVDDLPQRGNFSAAYAFRDSRNHEIIKLGETGTLRRRIFGNFIGGVGGRSDSTTQLVHCSLIHERTINHIEIAWIKTKTKSAARAIEKQFRQEYKAAHRGHRPKWDHRD